MKTKYKNPKRHILHPVSQPHLFTMKPDTKKLKSEKKTTTKTVKERKSAVPGEQVLLNYTYYLDGCQNRKIVLGFDPSNFEAKIIFHLHGRFPVSTNYSGWCAVFDHINKLKEETGEFLPENQFGLSKKYKIPVGEGSIQLQTLELLKLYEMMRFFNIVMYHNNSASESVKEYYNGYVTKCREKNTIKLPDEDFFIPLRASYVHVNYSRLFYEIPIFCSANVLFNTLCL